MLNVIPVGYCQGAARNAKYSILVAQMRAVRRGGGASGGRRKTEDSDREEMKTMTLLEKVVKHQVAKDCICAGRLAQHE